jgi:hypothetical protein
MRNVTVQKKEKGENPTSTSIEVKLQKLRLKYNKREIRCDLYF